MQTNSPTAELTMAIMRLLPAINAVISAHQQNADGSELCPYCTPAGRVECSALWLAACALDLVIRSRHLVCVADGGRCRVTVPAPTPSSST